MSKKILVFGASNSKKSINQQFAAFAGRQLEGVQIDVVTLNDYPLPLYSIDDQQQAGIPEAALSFLDKIKSSDGVIISLAEYNGLHTAAFKNLWDWLSRIEGMQIWNGKPMLLLSTSPSRKETNYVMKVSMELFPAFGANIIASFVLPSFNHFFKEDAIIEENHAGKFDVALQKFQSFLNQN